MPLLALLNPVILNFILCELVFEMLVDDLRCFAYYIACLICIIDVIHYKLEEQKCIVVE